MRDLYLKRNELKFCSKKLRVAKFQGDITREQIQKLVSEQDRIYKKYKFYDEYIKIGGKLK